MSADLARPAPAERDDGQRRTDFATLERQAALALESGYLPRSIRTPAQAITIVMSGQELGLPPMASLRLLSIIEGKPVLSAEGTLGLVHKRVRGARVDVVESTDTRAEIEVQRPGGKPARFSFTMDDARRAGLIGKDNWRKYPATMLRWRALQNACRAIFPDATLGLITPDEAEEIFPDAAAVPAPIIDTATTPSQAATGPAADAESRLVARFADEIAYAGAKELPAIGAAIAQAERDDAIGAAAIKDLRAEYGKRRAHLKKHAHAGDAPAVAPTPAPEPAVTPPAADDGDGDGYRQDFR